MRSQEKKRQAIEKEMLSGKARKVSASAPNESLRWIYIRDRNANAF